VNLSNIYIVAILLIIYQLLYFYFCDLFYNNCLWNNNIYLPFFTIKLVTGCFQHVFGGDISKGSCGDYVHSFVSYLSINKLL